MADDSLTIAEAVPLETVHLQQLLRRASVRSLVIKGPSFEVLGVRRRWASNDVDLLIHPDDRAAATRALIDAGWSIISHWFPAALDHVIYSTTFRHSRSPVTLDLHHRFSGLLAPAAGVFEALWSARCAVMIAHQPVTTVGLEHAVIIESLNATKLLDYDSRAARAGLVVADAVEVQVERVAAAAEEIGARHSAAPLIVALGGDEPSGPAPSGFARWIARGARASGRDLLIESARRAPLHVPRMLWQQLTLDPETARFWAHAHGVEYRSPLQILALRVRRMSRH